MRPPPPNMTRRVRRSDAVTPVLRPCYAANPRRYVRYACYAIFSHMRAHIACVRVRMCA